MQLNSHATNQDLVSEINFQCDSDNTKYLISDKVRQLNAGLEIMIGKIIVADGTYQFDDTNYTDAPRGKGNLVEGQEYYTFAVEYLQVEEIDILDTAGRYHRLKPIDPDDLGGLSPEEYFGVDSSGNPLKGFPQGYDIKGDSFRLYPAPTSTACTLTNGFRVTFKRTASLFTTTDTTKEPGVPSPYHVYLAYYASIPYCSKFKPQRVPWLNLQWEKGLADLIKNIAHREIDRRKVMTMKKVNYI